MDDQGDLNRLKGGGRFDIPAPAIALLLIISTATAALSAYSPLSIFGVLGTSCAAASTALLTAVLGGPLPMLVAIPAFGLAWLFVGSPLTAAASAAFVPCAAAIAIARKRGTGRSSAVMAAAVAFGLSAAIYLVVSVYIQYGALNSDVVQQIYDGYRADIVETVVDAYSNPDLGDQAINADTATEAIDYLLDYFTKLIPAIILCMILLTAYITTALYGIEARIFSIEGKYLPESGWALTLSVVSCYIFIAAYFFTIVFSASSQGALYMTALNLAVILTPGFVIIGIRAAKKFVRDRGMTKTTLILLVVSLLMILLNFAAFICSLSFIGVADIMLEYYGPKIKKHRDDQ